jgi:adenylosuccinate lyase
MTNKITALSPLDGRYQGKTEALSPYFSEFALIRHRVWVEVEWLIHLCNEIKLEGTKEFTSKEKTWLRNLYKKMTVKHAQSVKDIEKTTNHDVKAVEYFIKERMKKHTTKKMMEFVHFACTSEDINNLSYALMLQGALNDVILPTLQEVEEGIADLGRQGMDISMLSHTHGQPASPTTLGKEMTNVLVRMMLQVDQLHEQPILGKINGAVGNWNAHAVAYPDVDWINQSYEFIEKLGLLPMMHTTQIEPHDYIAELCHNTIRINTILMDFDRDMWTYIGKKYFSQKLKKGEVGSSTMPHKVNPIDFENSEGNLGMANSLLGHLASKLPISRMQRDLTDSTVLRNLGVVFGYSLLAYKSTLRGLSKLDINETKLSEDLNNHWEVLAEPLQTVMRRYKISKPYEKLKALTRGKGLTKTGYQKFIKGLKIPEAEKKRLSKLTPATYIGYAKELTESVL